MLFEPLDPRKMGEFDHLRVVLLSDPVTLSALDAASHGLAKACW
jgi:hypothetical protein